MGFGHRIYKKADPRCEIVKKYCKQLTQTKFGVPLLFKLSEKIEEIMIKEKKIHPNLDFYLASVFYQCGIPPEFFNVVLGMSRISGSAAHIIEQREENKLLDQCLTMLDLNRENL
jgi:2-methylcitrate synthase